MAGEATQYWLIGAAAGVGRTHATPSSLVRVGYQASARALSGGEGGQTRRFRRLASWRFVPLLHGGRLILAADGFGREVGQDFAVDMARFRYALRAGRREKTE